MLAAIPDGAADESVNKRTLAVLFGSRGAMVAAAAAVVLSAALAAGFDSSGVRGGVHQGISYFVLPHAAPCVLLLYRQAWRKPTGASGRIDVYWSQT